MKKIIFVILIGSLSIVCASSSKKELLEKQIKIEQAKEKKYAQEQMFYQNDTYDFKGSEVNPESLKYIKSLEVDELDMDSVYD
jgi:sortase (surface protein transpeptidase)